MWYNLRQLGAKRSEKPVARNLEGASGSAPGLLFLHLPLWDECEDIVYVPAPVGDDEESEICKSLRVARSALDAPVIALDGIWISDSCNGELEEGLPLLCVIRVVDIDVVEEAFPEPNATRSATDVETFTEGGIDLFGKHFLR